MRKLFTEFCSKSTIHGIRYITEPKRHWSERLWWICAFILSLLLCGASIRNIWMKWRYHPVTVSFIENELPISAIPFPQITVCQQTKFYKEKLDLTSAYSMYVSAPENLSHIELMRLQALFHVCPNDFFEPYTEEKWTNSSIYDTIEELSPTFEETLLTCEWRSTTYPCKDLFASVFTEDGLCFTFNALNSHEMYTENMAPEMMTITNNENVTRWSLDSGYKKGLRKKQYPRRMFNAKQGAALMVGLRLSTDDISYFCSGLIQGFKVTLTMPGDTRKSSSRYFQVLTSEQSEILIKPKMIRTSNKLHRYYPSQRQCFFNSERQLHFFKMYTQNNCEAEWEEHTKICGEANINCYKNAEKELFGEDVMDDLKNDSINMFRARCNCLPACTAIKYEADIDRTKFDWLHVLQSLNLQSPNLNDTQLSILSVFFADHQVITLQRSESYTFTDILAICGGLLGLFLGVSLLSIVEMIYFVTLRLFWTVWRARNDNVVVPFKRETIITRVTIKSIDSHKKE
ncbi:pickpocket protein 28-like [Contarinia nasturtii]|uniref:pickpocket protein 28-like n=1 Tax=Contarinia nasturtii TaxID=265458 RepID=UPI0012D39862|nr:pickpocket protein 28-like [Contarinia nasturtii]